MEQGPMKVRAKFRAVYIAIQFYLRLGKTYAMLREFLIALKYYK
jgi:hypothetical protein